MFKINQKMLENVNIYVDKFYPTIVGSQIKIVTDVRMKNGLQKSRVGYHMPLVGASKNVMRTLGKMKVLIWYADKWIYVRH